MSLLFELEPPVEGMNLQIDEEKDLSPYKDGGVVKIVKQQGVGNDFPNEGDKVTLRYIAYNGEVMAPEYIFDSSERDGKDFVYEVCRGRVIRGFELAVMSMRPQERAIIKLKPEYAFGRAGAPPKVPRDTPVIFDTFIKSVECPELSGRKDGSILKKTLERGKGWTQPNEGCMVKIYIKGMFGDTVFQDREVIFPFGEGPSRDYQVPKFVEELLDYWKMGERARLSLKSEFAFGAEGNRELGIPPNTDLVYDIKMIHFERVKDIWEMNNSEKMDQCDAFKEKGNFYFKREEYALALKFYERMLDYVEYDLCMHGEEEKRRHRIMVNGYLNKANVCLKLGKNLEARRMCDKVIDFDNTNVKAYFRRGQSYLATKDWLPAKADFDQVVQLEPDNKAAKNHTVICKQKIKDMTKEEVDLAQRMMSGIGKGGNLNDHFYGDGMNNIGMWNNDMAQGMMTLEQEREAFGEDMPPRGDNNHGNED